MSELSCQSDFASFNDQIWLNAASEGPLPNVSVQALHEAGEWKRRPYELTIPKFSAVPLQLKQAIGQLVHVPYQDVILGNSATYGIHLLANGLPLEPGDEVLLMQNDFPTDILPWLGLEKKGVKALQLNPSGHVLTPSEIADAISPKTKVLCLSYVHTFSGHILDVHRIGQICRDHNIIFILNLSQAAGAFPVDVSFLPVDAVVGAGYKWLLGPYGTGFCWIKPEIRETLQYNQAYWISQLNERELASTGPLVFHDSRSARRYDVFATANFFNFVPWTASLNYLLEKGMENVGGHVRTLVDIFLQGLDRTRYNLVSAWEIPERSNLIVFTPVHESAQVAFDRLKKQGIHVALWKGGIRVSPHIYNSGEDIRAVLRALT